jgi:hypothetical protein
MSRGKQLKLSVSQRNHLLELHDDGTHTPKELAELFSVCRTTVYRGDNDAWPQPRHDCARYMRHNGDAFTGRVVCGMSGRQLEKTARLLLPTVRYVWAGQVGSGRVGSGRDSVRCDRVGCNEL